MFDNDIRSKSNKNRAFFFIGTNSNQIVGTKQRT